MPTKAQMIQRHRSGEKLYSALASFALITTILISIRVARPENHQWWLALIGGTCALVTIRCTVRATLHRWSREASAALPDQPRER